MRPLPKSDTAQAQHRQTLRSRLARLGRDRRGATLPMMAMALLPIVAAIGGGVDYGRIYLVKTQLQTAVDAAALAGARAFGVDDDSANDRDTLADAYLHANYRDGYLGSSPVEIEKSFEITGEINATTVEATTTLPMAFMQIFGVQPVALSAIATAEVTPKPLEVMVVLDNTGSMQEALGEGKTRMDVLKEAMSGFLDMLFQGGNRRDELALGFVTYNVTTNVGHILKRHGVAVADVDGFTNVGNYAGGSSEFPDNPLAWKGCVNNDTTFRNKDANLSVSRSGDWDMVRSLPGEGLHPAVTPYHYMPSTTAPGAYQASLSGKATVPASYNSVDKNTNTADNRRNNLYRLGDGAVGEQLANSAAYRKHFHDFYIGLNFDETDVADDVIVRDTDGGYFRPGSGTGWKVNYARVPYLAAADNWDQPNPKYGYPSGDGYSLAMPSPNWQCPEESLEVAYGRDRSVYDDYIRDKNHPVMPASGTLHHIGMLWGYRLLTRSDVFTRPRAGPDLPARRALVFMTDGEVNVGTHVNWSSAYGRLADRTIHDTSQPSNFRDQILRRFGRVCELAKQDKIDVYIVSLKVDETSTKKAFSICAGTRYKATGNVTEIKRAFSEIAADLVELHLVK